MELERSSSQRPQRPTRDLPSLPLPSNSTESTASSPVSDRSFVTPDASPQLINHPLADSPTLEAPPSPEPSASSTTNGKANKDDTTLTPIRAHYLKKQLVQLQFKKEMDSLVNVPTTNINTFSYLGPPFTPPPKDGPRLDLPFLKYIFRHYVLSFPFLAAAPKNFFPDKLQPFMASMLSRNLSSDSVLDTNPDSSEEAARYRLQLKLQRNFSMLITTGTKLVEEEEVVRLTQKDLHRLEVLARKRAAREVKIRDTFDINVSCVRTVVERGRVRSRVHEEFIIRTRRTGFPDICVSRRYGDFKTLADELRKAYPAETVPPPPPKDRSFATVTVQTPLMSPSNSNYNSVSPSLSSSSVQSYNGSSSAISPPNSPTSNSTTRSPRKAVQRPYPSMPGLFESDQVDNNASQDSLVPPSPNTSGYGTSPLPGAVSYASKLAREKNRMTLRSYIHTLLSSKVLGSSPVLKSFLLANPTELTQEELEDAERREEADRLREDGRKRFAQEIKERVDGLRDSMRNVKGELLEKDGLSRVFATVKVTPNVADLPDNYKAVVEWARISLASTIFQHYVANDNASESFTNMKRIHGMMPYFMLKTALKISNPMAMIRGVLDLFLAQPFGGRSLLQRMFTGSLMEEVRALQEDIEAVKVKVDDATFCEKVRLFVYAPREIQSVYKSDAVAENINVLTVILRTGDDPALTQTQFQRVMRAHHAHKAYVKYTETLPDSDDDDGPQNEDAWLYEDLSLLAKLYARLRDREQLISLIFEGSTSEMLRDIITIFYTPLAQVYRAASISDTLSDLQNFMIDLIKTVESCEELSQEDPSKTVQNFIDLVQRHEQSFYHFVHKVHSKGEALFHSLMSWIERFLTLMREGLGEPISLEFLLPHTGEERKAIMQEVDDIARYHYKLKLAHEAKVRKRFGRAQNAKDTEADEQATTELVNGVVQDLSFSELIRGDADDMAAEESEEDLVSSDEEEEEEEESSDDDESDTTESDGEDDGESSSSEESNQAEPGASSSNTGPGPPPPAKSQTGAYSPRSNPKGPLPLAHIHAATVDIGPPSPSRQSTLRPSRSMTLTNAKELPALPPSSSTSSRPPIQRSSATDGPPRLRRKNVAPVKKKKPGAPKPPDLVHIPTLLPLFAEVMRPLMRTSS